MTRDACREEKQKRRPALAAIDNNVSPPPQKPPEEGFILASDNLLTEPDVNKVGAAQVHTSRSPRARVVATRPALHLA